MVLTFLKILDQRYKLIPVLFLLTALTVYADCETDGSNPFAEGNRLMSLTAGVSVDSSLGRIYLTQYNISRYILDYLAIYYGANIGYAEAKKTRNGLQGGPEIGMRWHFVNIQRWSLYFGSSVAAVFHRYPLSEGSLRFNFDLQAGIGAVYRFDKKRMLQGGFKWHHFSNARIRGKAYNIGYDAPMLYLGIMQVF